jgi:tetratricopeptide (TPR) repeat protein
MSRKKNKKNKASSRRGRLRKTNVRASRVQFDVERKLRKAVQYHQAGQLQNAEDIYRQIIKNEPENANANHLLGVLALQVGKNDIAVQFISKAIEKDSSQYSYYSSLGDAFHRQGELDGAIESYRRALSINPGSVQAYGNLGNALRDQGKLDEAIESYEKVLSIQPDSAQAHYSLGVALKDQGRLDDAIESYRRALNINPDFAEAHHAIGRAFKHQGQRDDAIESYRRALSVKSDYSQAHNNLGIALDEQGKLDDAIESYRRALSINPNFAQAYGNLGNALKDQGKPDDAIKSYKKALNINPDLAEVHNNLGILLHEHGRRDDAIESYQKALSIRPNFAEAHRHLACVTRHTEHVQTQKMISLYKEPHINDNQRMHLAFGLGKAFEDLGDHEESFKFILEGNRLRRNTFSYNTLEDKELFNDLKNVFGDQLFRRNVGSGCVDNTPIFIIGMLRSGSTLVEQILASHPLVYGAGELDQLAQMTIHSCETLVDNRFPNCVTKLSPENLAMLGAHYVRAVKQYSGSARYITDKTLLNFRFVGMIKLILPNAKIIHCKRDPRDTCLSVFKNYFTDLHKYAHDLSELGQYYKLYQGLMEHWHSILPGYIFDIQYEDIVGNQDAETRRLLEYCELPWDEACLSFYNTVRPVRTVSVEQVRRPIYNSSVGLWRQYEKHLEPLLNALE